MKPTLPRQRHQQVAADAAAAMLRLDGDRKLGGDTRRHRHDVPGVLRHHAGVTWAAPRVEVPDELGRRLRIAKGVIFQPRGAPPVPRPSVTA